MLKRTLLSFFLVLSVLGSSFASHLMGGEITWKCLPSGQFQFFMKLYRDCNSSVGITNPQIEVHNYGPTVMNLPLTLISQTDISPSCNAAGPAITCAGASGNTPGAVEEFIYQTAPVTLSGVPPPEGWIFTYDNCCRNGAITNLVNPQNQGFTLRAKMYSYNGQNTNPCFDSSPTFAEIPATVICTGYPFTYNHNAFDAELDSLVFDFAQPLGDFTGTYNTGANNPPQLAFTSGYSYSSPLPSPTQNPNNVAADINQSTGEISYTSFTQGNFVSVVEVKAYRCGTLIAEVYRELQVVLIGTCGSNNPPDVTPPFPDQNGNYTQFADTVTAGELVTFSLSGTDFETLPNGDPQTMTLTATGSQFAPNYTSTTSGCLNPPCATLSPPPPQSGQFGVATNFSWQTTCDHISYSEECAVFSNTYTFVIRVQDDFCPAPAQNIATISITVEALPVIKAPSFRCVSVLGNGDVRLTWVPPLDTANTFNSYHVYHSTDPAGPFTVVDSIFNYNQTTYTHTSANTAGPNYYYLRSRSGCNGQVMTQPSDTLASIFLTADNPGTGTADLSWNPLADPLPPTTLSGYYRIYREYPIGTWTLIDSTQGLSYQDTITLCDELINYRVEIEDSSGCVSVSSIDGDLFQDATVPEIPTIDSVSVDTAGNVFIGWNANPSEDTEGYVVYQDVNGAWIAVDTVWGQDSTLFIHTGANPDGGSESYVVAAFDSCINTSPLSVEHNTIFMQAQLDECLRKTELSWNEYINWPGGVNMYEIWASEDGAPPSLVGSVAGGSTSFTHTGLTQYATYCYIVRAVDTSGTKTSSSNDTCIFADIPLAPSFGYINYVTVNADGSVELSAYVDSIADVIEYEIFRSEDEASYSKVGTAPFTGDSIITYTDNSALTSDKSYYYKVVAVDSCGGRVDTTDYARTIHLQAEGKADRKNYLDWNQYEGWLGGVEGYNIYRSIDGIYDPVPIANLPAGTNEYVDDVANITEGDGTFCYYIEALEGDTNMYGFEEMSESNRGCALQLPNFFVPNAFAPEGVNQIFKPVTLFVDEDGYRMEIYTRWGEKIFVSLDIDEGWDGTFEGQIVPQGPYVYYFQFRSAAGELYEKRGTVTLLR